MTALQLIFEEPAAVEPEHPTLRQMVGIPDTRLAEYVRWTRTREGTWAINLDLLPSLRPKIWALAGTTARAGAEATHTAAAELVARGDAVFYPVLTSPSDDERRVQAHLKQLDIADSLYVVNPGGYVGSDTQREVDYASARGKRVVYLEYL